MVSRRFTLLAAGGLLLVLFSGSSVNALPLFSDHTGPTEGRITELDRLDAGCADEVATYVGSSVSGGNYTKVTTIDAATANDGLSATVERLSPRGADLSTFVVAVDTHAAAPPNETCDVVVQYRLTVTFTGGSDEGLLPDAHGHRVFWFENGRKVGCSASVTSPLAGCRAPGADEPEPVWANATA